MRGALVIRYGRYGDPALAAAIEGGMRRAEAQHSKELEIVKAEMQKMRENEASLGVRVVRDERYYREKIAEAEENYGWLKPSTNPITNALWGLYGYIVDSISDWVDYFHAEMSK